VNLVNVFAVMVRS